MSRDLKSRQNETNGRELTMAVALRVGYLTRNTGANLQFVQPCHVSATSQFEKLNTSNKISFVNTSKNLVHCG